MTWKEHPIIIGYVANEEGEIARIDETSLFPLDSIKIVKQTLKDTGYLCFTDSLRKKSMVSHRFVYECFYGLIPKGLVIDHINTDKTDNRLCNLRAVSVAENNANPLTKAKQLESQRERRGRAVLKLDKRTGEVIERYRCMKEAAALNNIDHNNMRAVCQHKPGHYSCGGFKWEYAA